MGLEVGDWQVATLTVSVYDGSTQAALTVIAPDDTETALTPTTADGGASWTAPAYELTMPGEWVERWTVTGTGKSQERRVLQVAPDPTEVPDGQRIYANTADYAKHLRAAPPANSRTALARASTAVDDMLLCAVYDTDDAGMPTLPAVIAALREATCVQAEDAREAKRTSVAQFSIGSVSVTRRSAPQPAPEEGYRSPRAWRVLQRAGLTGTAPWSW